MSILAAHGIEKLYHFFPLHYLPFIARDRVLKSKPELAKAGFRDDHNRSTSAHLDGERGFGHYVHLSTVATPPILKAKLKAGFPHIGIEIASDTLGDRSYDLCRFNIAKTRYLRRGEKPGSPETPANGRYYGKMEIPIARTLEEKASMLTLRQSETMIEVLVPGSLPLTDHAKIRVYRKEDCDEIKRIQEKVGSAWDMELQSTPRYVGDEKYIEKVSTFIDKVLEDSEWLGDGLEFDRV